LKIDRGVSLHVIMRLSKSGCRSVTMKRFFFILSIVIGMICGGSLLATAYQWGSTTGTDTWNGSTTGGFIHEGNGAFLGGVFNIASASDTLTITQTVKIKGDVEIHFLGDGTTSSEAFYVDIYDSTTSNSVNITAYTDSSVTATGYSQLVFNAEAGKVIVVSLYNDLNFYSADALAGYDGVTTLTGAPIPLYVSFRGRGTTVFLLPSGQRLYFGPPSPGKTGDSSLSDQGVHVRVLMDQSYLEAVEQKKDQLRFEKWSYDVDSANSMNLDLSLDSWVTFGQRSSLAYLSANIQGVSEKWVDTNGDNDIDLGEPVIKPGYGTIAFDPSNKGTGRLILELARGVSPAGNDFTDAGVNVFGVYVAPTTYATDYAAATILNSDFRNYVYFNQRAGIRAIMRIVDTVAFSALVTDTTNQGQMASWTGRDEGERRGLLVINHNNSIPKLANNYDQASTIDVSKWAIHNDYQPGFMVGVNGELFLRPHTFLDYIANGTNQPIVAAQAAHATSVAKKHNPAALYIDGLATYALLSNRQNDQWGVPIDDLFYLGHKSDFGVHAQITLQGDAGIFVRSAAPYDASAYTKPEFLQPKRGDHYHLTEHPTLTGMVMTYTLGIGKYDGTHVSILDSSNAYVMQETDPEGSHALEIGGKLTISSVAGPYGETKNGFMKVPSLHLDHAGRELIYSNFDAWLTDTSVTLTEVVLTQRPVTLNKWAAVYDISSILVNDDVYLDNVTLIHDDVTRDLTVPIKVPTSAATARPHIVGGEFASIKSEVYPPLVYLYNSTIKCHESLIATGVSLTVNEVLLTTGQTAIDAHNTSKIICYNRGREYDTDGYGRVVQFGSLGNLMANGSTSNSLLRDGYLDINRAAATTGSTTSDPTIICLSLETAQESGVTQAEAALHTIFLANGSQISLGWPTEEADTGYAPWNFSSTVLTALKEADPNNINGYRFDPYSYGVGELRIQGDTFYFGAGDQTDNSPPDMPILGLDTDGVVYVNHGGKISTSGSYDVFFNTVIGRRLSATAAASGMIDVPNDQIHFLSKGAIQSYDVDFVGDKYTSGSYSGYVPLGIVNPVHLIGAGALPAVSGFEPVK